VVCTVGFVTTYDVVNTTTVRSFQSGDVLYVCMFMYIKKKKHNYECHVPLSDVTSPCSVMCINIIKGSQTN